MAISVLNANVEIVSCAIEALHKADLAVLSVGRNIPDSGANSSSLSTLSPALASEVNKALGLVLTASKKASLLKKAFSKLETLLREHNRRMLSIVQTRHIDVSGFANKKPMAFLADYDLVPAKTILAAVYGSYTSRDTEKSRVSSDFSDQTRGNAWSAAANRFLQFLNDVRSYASRVNGGFPSLISTLAPVELRTLEESLRSLSTLTIPSIFRFSSARERDGGMDQKGSIYTLTRDGSIADHLVGVLTTDQQTMLKGQHECLRKELEILEYTFGVSKTRYIRDEESNRPFLQSTEQNVSEKAQRDIYLAHSLMISTGIHLVDYHFRIGRYSEAAKYLCALERDALSLTPTRPPSCRGEGIDLSSPATPAEFKLAPNEYATLSGLKHIVALASVSIYHTFHTEHFCADPIVGVVKNALERVRHHIASAKGAPVVGLAGGASAAAGSGANAARQGDDTRGELFVKTLQTYERHYAASSSGRVLKLGTPMPCYGLPDDETTTLASSSGGSSGFGERTPIAVDALAYDGSHLIEDINVQTAFNPFCGPLFSIADYTLLAVAEFYHPLCTVIADNRRRLLIESASFTNKATVAKRRALHSQSSGSLLRWRIHELTGAKYDLVKTFMFGQYSTDECVEMAERQLRQHQQQQQNSADAGHQTTRVTLTFSDNTPVLAEIAKIASVLAVSILGREELKSNFLALPEVQVLLGAEAEYTQEQLEARLLSVSGKSQKQHDDNDNATGGPSVNSGCTSAPEGYSFVNPYVLLNDQTNSKVSTTARAVVQGCYDTNYSDSMIGLATAPNSMFTDFFLSRPYLDALVPHAKQDIRESIVRRMLRPYASISISQMVNRLRLYSGSDPEGQLLEELKSMIAHGKLGDNVRINWEQRTVIKLQNSYGGTSGAGGADAYTQKMRAAILSSSSSKGGAEGEGDEVLYKYPRADGAVLAIAEQLQSQVGVAYQRSIERLLRTASVRAMRLDQPISIDDGFEGNRASLAGKVMSMFAGAR